MEERTLATGPQLLDCGETLSAVEQRVTMYGEPRRDGSNVVLVEHALTGSSRVADWWPGIVGEGALFDPRRWCIIGINALGSCYGSTGPDGGRFPRVTVRDIVRAERRALDLVGITADWLFRPTDVRAAAQRFAERGFTARYLELHSDHGHDAFLAESDALRALLEPLVIASAKC